RTAARVAFGIRAGRTHVTLALRRLPTSFASGVAGGVARAGTLTRAVADAVTLRVDRGASSSALARTGSLALPDATTLTVPREPSRIAVRNDLSRVDLGLARPIAARFGLRAHLALRRTGRGTHADALPHDRVDARSERFASSLGLAAGTLLRR